MIIIKHLGDITLIKGYDAPVVDCVIGGSPCQDLSLAGKRAGLAGARSGLYMEQIRIIKEMRERDRISGRTDVDVRPRYMVWENVPGAFSTNGGQDFAAVLEEAIRVAEPEAPNVPVPEKGWPTAGCFFDEMGKWSVAWRVMDAQFWGVPQRRRRICLVCDFNGLNAPKIVFGEAEHHRSTKRDRGDTSVGHSGAKSRPKVQPIPQGLSGHPDESQPKGKEAPGDAGDSTGGAVGCDLYNGALSGDKAVSLNTNANATGAGPTVICVDQGGGKSGAHSYEDVSPTLTCTHDGAPAVVYGISPYHSNCMLSDNPHSGIYEAETSRTLDALNCGYPGCNQGGMAVVQPMAYSIENHPADSRVGIDESGMVQTLTSRMGTGGGNVPMVMESVGTFQETGIGWWNKSDVGATLRAMSGGDAMKANLAVTPVQNCKILNPYDSQGNQIADGTGNGIYPTLRGCGGAGYQQGYVFASGVDCRNATEYPEMNGTIQAKSNGGFSLNCNQVVRVKHIVRRLTPLECERLQGFPDGWTDIGEWVDSNGKKHKEADSPRYKALGNSIALPPWKWVLKRLCACYERDATMASLFDGIGGFPYIWEQLNGKGSCLWASEIEEFPMAVTKLRFGGSDNG